MDLALNNQQRLIFHKTQPTNQPISSRKLYKNRAPVCKQIIILVTKMIAIERWKYD